MEEFQKNDMAEGRSWKSIGHYTADGKEWAGDQHAHNGQIMTGKTHDKNSVYLYHYKELSAEVRKKIDAEIEEAEKDLRLRDLEVVDPTDGSWGDEMGFLNRRYMKRQNSYVTEDSEDECYSEALTAIQRIKRRAIMRKSKAAIARGRRRSEKKKPTLKVMKNRALKAARNLLFKKLAGQRSKDELSFSERSRIEKVLSKKQGKIKAIAKKILPKLIQKEKAKRAKKAAEKK